jgi:LysM domain
VRDEGGVARHGSPRASAFRRPGVHPAQRPVRLTRRGRRAVWAVAALLLAAVLTPVLIMVSGGAQAASQGLPASAVRAGMRAMKVRPGDSLWSVALRAEPSADPRVVSQEIIRFNALSGDVLIPGETLWVPRG